MARPVSNALVVLMLLLRVLLVAGLAAVRLARRLAGAPPWSAYPPPALARPG
ncbi:MAG TPA: hypothetical protein VFU22_24985 [Roseiflexaceae bacterium]|nr:hypothetical protein [Roseiflexaceae bacterium]